MWIIQEPSGTLHERGNLPSHNLLPTLLEQFPGSRILRSRKPCHNEFGALAFAKEWVQDGEVEVIGADGEIIKQPVMVCRRVGNTHALEGGDLVVRDTMGAVIGTFPMELVYEPEQSA